MALAVRPQLVGVQVWVTGWGQRWSVQEQKDQVTDAERAWALNRPRPQWPTSEGWAEFRRVVSRT